MICYITFKFFQLQWKKLGSMTRLFERYTYNLVWSSWKLTSYTICYTCKYNQKLNQSVCKCAFVTPYDGKLWLFLLYIHSFLDKLCTNSSMKCMSGNYYNFKSII
jgi:hypothetical protein